MSMNIIAAITDIRLLRELTRQEESACRPCICGGGYTSNDIIIKGINDSKKFRKKRELFEEITEKAIAYNIFSVDENELTK